MAPNRVQGLSCRRKPDCAATGRDEATFRVSLNIQISTEGLTNAAASRARRDLVDDTEFASRAEQLLSDGASTRSADRDEDAVMTAGAVGSGVGPLLRLDITAGVRRADLDAVPA